MRRGLCLLGFAVSTWLGCSSSNDSEPPPAALAGAGAAHGGETSTGGAAPAGGSSQGGAQNQGGSAGGMVNSGGSFSGAGGSAGSGAAPAGWACIYFSYGDGKCDCGCGVPDKDCSSAELSRCEVCNNSGSCSPGACPGRIDAADVTRCIAVPDSWTCDAASFGDATCDCGCGAKDVDCADGTAASCENCADAGSCANGPCPASIAQDDNTRCELPEKWWCDPATYGDGTCNCGCGALDVDCSDATAEACELCDKTSCSPFSCLVEPEDNSRCPEPPPTWRCSPRLYGDGARCDCGCGGVDPDCDSPKLEACDKCDSPGSCAAQACPAFISAESNGTCDSPSPPPGWTCAAAAYADGITCDCGCGVMDSDCRSDDYTICQRCLDCGGHGFCEGTIDPEDMTKCGPPPPEWICSAESYRDLICDCGCGLLDSYCQETELSFICQNYPVEGCSAGNRTHIDPNHNMFCIIEVPEEWTCDRTFYDDGFCDCGCGVQDLDCPADDVDACETCDAMGSCSSDACPGTIDPDDTAQCVD